MDTLSLGTQLAFERLSLLEVSVFRIECVYGNTLDCFIKKFVLMRIVEPHFSLAMWSHT